MHPYYTNPPFPILSTMLRSPDIPQLPRPLNIMTFAKFRKTMVSFHCSKERERDIRTHIQIKTRRFIALSIHSQENRFIWKTKWRKFISFWSPCSWRWSSLDRVQPVLTTVNLMMNWVGSFLLCQKLFYKLIINFARNFSADGKLTDLATRFKRHYPGYYRGRCGCGCSVFAPPCCCFPG